jgi:cytoskeletal protein CcmA (bactofilin family)
MFRRSPDKPAPAPAAPDRVDSILGSGLTWQGNMRGSGGVRIEGAYDGEIEVHGIVVIGESGRVTCDQIVAATVVVAGSLKGNIKAYRVEITSTGRVWGDVITTAFATEEGAFLRGKITMEEEMDLGLAPEVDEVSEEAKGADS